MSGLCIKGMEMPENCYRCLFFRMTTLWNKVGEADTLFRCVRTGEESWEYRGGYLPNCPLIPVPEHGRLIDADVLRQAMYHEAFETDSPMQKWDSGCWIRYKMFERMEEAAPTIIPAEEGEG